MGITAAYASRSRKARFAAGGLGRPTTWMRRPSSGSGTDKSSPVAWSMSPCDRRRWAGLIHQTKVPFEQEASTDSASSGKFSNARSDPDRLLRRSRRPEPVIARPSRRSGTCWKNFPKQDLRNSVRDCRHRRRSPISFPHWRRCGRAGGYSTPPSRTMPRRPRRRSNGSEQGLTAAPLCHWVQGSRENSIRIAVWCQQ